MEQFRWWLTTMGTLLITWSILRSIYFAARSKRRAEHVGTTRWTADLFAETWGFFAATLVGTAMLVGAVLVSVW